MYNEDYLLRGTIKNFCLHGPGCCITMQSASDPFQILNVMADLHECVYPSNGRHPNAIFSKCPLINKNNMAEARTREFVSLKLIFRF